MEENRFQDFVELLEAYKPMIEDTLTGFDGRSIHPVTTRTLATEMKTYSRGHSPRRDMEARTVVLLDRGASMAEPWTLWEQYPKIMVARFLANAVAASHSNSVVYSFGEPLRSKHSLNDLEPLDEALRHMSLLEPERLMILTDSKPVHIDGVETDESCEKTVRLLDALGRSGVQTMILTLSQDREIEKIYGQLMHTPGTLVSPLRVGGDVVRMMQRLAEWF